MAELIHILTTPRTMSAWLSNLLTIPHQSLFVHDPIMEDGLLDSLQHCELPRVGTVMTVGPEYRPWEPLRPDFAIVADAEAMAGRTSALFGSNMNEAALSAHERLYWVETEVLWIEQMDEWIESVYEYCTGQPMDWLRYAALKNLYVECRFAARMRTGQTDLDGLKPLAKVLEP